MNTIGVSCTNFSSKPFPEILERISSSFRHWEIFSELEHYGPLVVERYGELVADSELTFSLHTGIADINVASTNELIREASVLNLRKEMESANRLGIDTVTIHPGIINLAVKGVRDRSLAQANRSMQELDRMASEFGVTACIENMPNFPMMLGVDAEELDRIVDGTSLSICFDIGHAHTFGQVERMVEIFGDRICNVHIHDNHGESDEHLTIGDGNVDFTHVLALLKSYTRRYIIESRSIESAEISQTRLRKMLDQ